VRNPLGERISVDTGEADQLIVTSSNNNNNNNCVGCFSLFYLFSFIFFVDFLFGGIELIGFVPSVE
jgi:hypothetical protein